MKSILLPLLLAAAMAGPAHEKRSADTKLQLPFNQENVTRALKECHLNGGYLDSKTIIIPGLFTPGTPGPDFAAYRRCLNDKLVLPADFNILSV